MKAYLSQKTRRMDNVVFNLRNGSIIKKNGVEIFMEHRLRKFFSVLYERKNEVVTRSELLQSVWNDVLVSDDSITKAAFDLRRFFKKNEIDEFQLITIPKIGYQLKVVSKKRTPMLFRVLKVGGYLLILFLAIITIVRAVNY